MKKVRVPVAFKDAALKQLVLPQFISVTGYAKNFREQIQEGKGLLLSGPPGTGKSYAISALTRYFVEKVDGISGGHFRVKNDHEFVTAPDFFENLAKGDFGESSDGFRGQSWLRTYTTVSWLVLNDLGKENRGGKFASQIPYQLGRVIRARNERKRVTHITTNLDGAGIVGHYGESIASLFSEMMTTVVIQGADRRQQ